MEAMFCFPSFFNFSVYSFHRSSRVLNSKVSSGLITSFSSGLIALVTAFLKSILESEKLDTLFFKSNFLKFLLTSVLLLIGDTCVLLADSVIIFSSITPLEIDDFLGIWISGLLDINFLFCFAGIIKPFFFLH